MTWTPSTPSSPPGSSRPTPTSARSTGSSPPPTPESSSATYTQTLSRDGLLVGEKPGATADKRWPPAFVCTGAVGAHLGRKSTDRSLRLAVPGVHGDQEVADRLDHRVGVLRVDVVAAVVENAVGACVGPRREVSLRLDPLVAPGVAAEYSQRQVAELGLDDAVHAALCLAGAWQDGAQFPSGASAGSHVAADSGEPRVLLFGGQLNLERRLLRVATTPAGAAEAGRRRTE